MSKNIIIQEGGVDRQLTASKLRTVLVGGGTCLWVPEDEATLRKKTITEDGTYKAVDDGIYGYSQVTVRGIGKVVGKDQDSNEIQVNTDADGNLTFTKVPSTIRVTVKPDKRVYAPNELLDYTGIVVTKCDANGGEMGTIPFEQLIFPMSRTDGPIIPEGRESGDGKIRANVLATMPMIISGQQAYLYPYPLDYYQGSDGKMYGRTIGTFSDEMSAPPALLATRYNGNTYMARIDQNGGDFKRYGFTRNPDTGVWSWTASSTMHINYDEFCNLSWGDYYTCEDIPMSTADPTGYRPSGMAETGAQMAIPVQWIRPEDEKTLETTFEVEVTADGEETV